MAKSTKSKYYKREIDKVIFSLINKDVVERLEHDGKIELPKRKIDIPKDMRWNEKTMNSAVLKGINNGDSVNTIAKRLFPEAFMKADLKNKTKEEIYGKGGIIAKNKESTKRAARTMTTSAENHGRLDSYKTLDKQGIVQKKVWMATPDDRTRKSHIDIDGEEQDIDKEFSNKCMFPGDAAGPADEVWNCRCSMRDHIVGFRRKDGTISEVGYKRDKTMHDEQMEAEKERRGIKDEPKPKANNDNKVKAEKNAEPKEQKPMPIPSSLKNYEYESQRYKAKKEDEIIWLDGGLKQGVKTREDLEKLYSEANKMLKDIVGNNEFRMRIPDDDEKILASILKDGRFKTQFETGTSKGMLSSYERSNVTEKIFGANTKEMSNSDFEKYGYLGSKDIAKDLREGDKLRHHGEGVVTFKKDGLTDRTTMTLGDSLNSLDNYFTGGLSKNFMATKVDNIDAFLAQTDNKFATAQRFTDRIKEGITKSGIDNATSIGRSAFGDYIELQYHGDLTLKDVDSITMSKDIWDKIAKDSKAVEAIKSNGITCNYVEKVGDKEKLIEYVFKGGKK